MNQEEQQVSFYESLRALVDRYGSEYDLTYASMIGVLTMMIMELNTEADEILIEELDDDDREDWQTDEEE